MRACVRACVRTCVRSCLRAWGEVVLTVFRGRMAVTSDLLGQNHRPNGGGGGGGGGGEGEGGEGEGGQLLPLP